MAFTELELKRCNLELEEFMLLRRPPPEIRPKLDLGYKIAKQSVEIFELRPDWQDKSISRETPIAKITFVRNQQVWRIFWMRSDLKWHGYVPHASVRSLAKALEIVGKDEHCCFFG